MDDKIRIGVITAAVGIKGEVRVMPFTDTPERFRQVKFLELDGKRTAVQSGRVMKNMAVIKLQGVNSRNDAELLQNKELWIDRKDLWKVPEDTYFVQDLQGSRIFLEDGTPLGTLTKVIANPGHDLYEITKKDGKSFLLPAVKEFVRAIDLEKQTVTVRLIEGLEDL